jgi:hypothetical protein
VATGAEKVTGKNGTKCEIPITRFVPYGFLIIASACRLGVGEASLLRTIAAAVIEVAVAGQRFNASSSVKAAQFEPANARPLHAA